MTSQQYIPIWHKYRPVILKMMIESSKENQIYQLSNHEFKARNAKQKGGYAFTLQVAHGRAVGGLRDSEVARDLWEILQLSPKASEMIADSTFEFHMDKQFKLHINKISA